MADELYEWSTLTRREAAGDLLGHVVRWGLLSDELRTTKFRARVLTDGVEVGNMGSAQEQLTFKARILGNNSPHKQIPDPCDPAYFDDPEYVYKLIAQHTTFVSINPTSLSSPVTRGDIVSVELEKTGKKRRKFHLKYGRYLKLLSIEDPPSDGSERCAALIKIFGEIVHTPFDITKMDIRANAGSPRVSRKCNNPLSWRNLSFDSIKHSEAAELKPANAGSNNLPTYFGEANWKKYKESLAAFEGTWDSENKWHYLGKYQMGIMALYDGKYLQNIGDWDCPGRGQGTSCIEASGKFLDNPANWTGLNGVNSKADFKANHAAQDKNLRVFASKDFVTLKNAGALDLNNPADVAGMVAGAHLAGASTMIELRKNGKEKSDANCMYPSRYYTGVGKTMVA